MKYLVSTVAAASLVTVAASWCVAAVATFDDAAALEGWTFYEGREFPGATGRIAWEGGDGRAAPGCLALHHDFAGGGNYVQAGWTLPRDNQARSVRLWLRKPHRHRVTFRCVDSQGQTFQKGVDYDFDEWQQIEIELTGWQSFFGGAADGRVRFPIRQFAILIENNAEPRQGVLLIDDVELIEGAADAEATADSLATYTASDFAGQPGWSAGGGEGNRFEDRVWTYAFNEGREPALTSHFSLLGRPRSLRLVVAGDTLGSAVHVELGSHFQTFYREIGRLTGQGEQAIEVPLGDMSTWQHRGGQDDGQLRLPLRMQRIRLTRANGPPQGTLRLVRLEVDTLLPPGQTVLMVPDARLEDGEARFSVRVSNVVPQQASGQLVCDMRSIGSLVRREIVDLSLDPAGAPVVRTFTCPMGDHRSLDAMFSWIAAGSASPPAYIGVGTWPEEPAAPTLEPNSPFGMGMYLYRWRGNPHARERMTEAARLAQRAGVKWTREEFQWHAIEPARGQFEWAFYDDLVATHLAHGIQIYGLLCYWSGWTKPNTDEGISDYCAWVRQVVRRYRDRIRHWQIWNEPNIFFWTGPREMYADLLAQAYAVIKEEDPDAVVLGCSSSGIDTGFIRMVMERGGRFDALAVHPYRGALNDLDYIRELKAAHELSGGRPLWLTEIGFPTQQQGGWSERNQASMLARIYTTSLASGVVANVSWYNFRNDGPDPFESEQNFGVVRTDFRPKPAYAALAAVAHQLAGVKVAGQIAVGEGAYAFRFSGDGEDVIVACAPVSGRLLTIEAIAKLSACNAVGEPIALARDGDRVTVTLDAGFPVYIRGPAGFACTVREPAVSVRADKLRVRPGDAIALDVYPRVEVADWELPPGWPRPEKQAAGGYRLDVPAEATAGEHLLRVIVRQGALLRIPVVVRVQPQVLRV
ncbi:MAG: hypothetical protein GXY55_15780 [Phycisphaerae bacterium]|nr:hypothetical protein [Phycisphaerae bacterium]